MDELKRLLEELTHDEDDDGGRPSLDDRDLYHRLNEVEKSVDDVLWYHKLGDAGSVEKIHYVGPPPENTEAQSDQEEGNRVIVPAYVFTPAETDTSGGGAPGLVLPHGGVHANFSTRYAPIVRELLEQGYYVIAPEYRGSTGYGQKHYELIDYGGLEAEDTYEGREWLVEHCPVDPDRVGILGWSHGGLHTLFNVFEHPDAYAVAYAGVPVSDLVARMGYKSQEYRDLYEAEYHVAEAAHENPDAYRERSPVWHAEKLETPLRIHTTTNDEDVNVLEVEALIRALKAENKEFEYEVYEDAPGAHSFERLDTAFASESREAVYDHLAAYLNPPNRE